MIQTLFWRQQKSIILETTKKHILV